MKRFDALIAVGLGVLILAIITIVTGRQPSAVQRLREQVAVLAAKPNEKPGGEIQIVIRDAASGNVITKFQYYVFDSDSEALRNRDNVDWHEARDSQGEAYVQLETTEEQRIVVVRVKGYRDCAFWEPLVGDKIFYWMSAEGGQRPSRAELADGSSHPM